MSPGFRPLGRWTYDASSHELRAGEETVRLPARVGRALELLSEHGGQVVTREQLIDRVWDGRSLSDNSVPMVIGHLRKALGQGPGSPVIETIPKRGYRLKLSQEAGRERPRAGRRLRQAASAVALVLAVLAIWGLRPGSAEAVIVPPITDETGSPRYAALAQASDALLVSRLVERGIAVERRPGGEGDVLRARLVLWEGRPFLALAAEERGRVVWSAMIDGANGGIPRALNAKLSDWAEAR